MSEQIVDVGNPNNEWQGSMRFGSLDLVLLKYAARVCQIDGLVVNCVDQLPDRARICTGYKSVNSIEMPQTLRQQAELTSLLKTAVAIESEVTTDEVLHALDEVAPVMITSRGPTHTDRQLGQALPFSGRHRREEAHAEQTPLVNENRVSLPAF